MRSSKSASWAIRSIECFDLSGCEGNGARRDAEYLCDGFTWLKESEVIGGFDDEAVGDEDLVYLTAAEGDALIVAMYQVMDRFEAPDFKLHMAGAFR